MRELLILLVVIAVIAVIWYRRKESARSGEQRPGDQARRYQAPEANPTALTGAAGAAPQTRDAESRPTERSTGLLQEAAASAAGRPYEEAADQMEGITADLAKAREEAERAAERLASQAGAALASIQAAAEAHGGAVPGDGTHNCPSSYPIKGNIPSMRYHKPRQPSYNRTIPEVCFQSIEAAEAAGFTESGDEAGMRGGTVGVEEVMVEEVMVEEVAVIDDRGRIEAVVAEAVEIRDREDGERVDVVAAAIAAADAGGVPPGAVRGDGSRDCPPTYPIKGNQESMLYHEPGTPTYLSTVPEFCFSSVDSAQAAGFSATQF